MSRVAAAVGVMLGCVGTSRAAPTTPPPATRLMLPRQFVAQGNVALRLSASRDAATADQRLRLLRSPDAPEEFTALLRPPRVCGAANGSLTALRIEGADGAPITATIREGAVVLRARADGAADIDVRGEYFHGATGCVEGLAAGARVPVHARLRVEASGDAGRPRIGGAGRCGDDNAPFAGTRSTVPLRLELLDAADEPLSFVNLSPLAPFEVQVEADIAVTAVRDGELGLAERSGRVRLVAPGARDAWSWRWRVEPEEVTDATVRFYVPGNAGTPMELTEGVRVEGGNRKLGGIFFEVRRAVVGDGPLCDAPDARWFRMRSETPEVCAVVAVNSQSCDGCVGPGFGHEAARFLRDGRCAVRLEAPALDRRRGLQRSVSVEVRGVENFAEGFPSAG